MMYWNGDWGWGGWVLMTMTMLAFWGLVAWVAVTLIRATNRGDSRSRDGDAAEILAQRFARGEIDETEYRRRLDVVRGRHHSGVT